MFIKKTGSLTSNETFRTSAVLSCFVLKAFISMVRLNLSCFTLLNRKKLMALVSLLSLTKVRCTVKPN